VKWYHDIFEAGSHWGHQQRIRNSSQDLGAQAAPLRLLIKDHKPWDGLSNKPIPSRPVVNGKSGYNCHLSEVLSLILGPVSKEANGQEICSTEELLAKINEINLKIESEQLQPNNSNPSSDFSTKGQNSDFDQFCDYCINCNRPPPT